MDNPRFSVPFVPDGAYAFHVDLKGSMKGIEIYLVEDGRKKAAQAFYSPDTSQRVGCCMVLLQNREVSEVYTLRDDSFLAINHDATVRQPLSDDEVIEFASRGMKVTSIDTK